MRQLPSAPYSGLSVILSEKSRFDKDRLLSGYSVERLFDNELLAAGFNHVHRGSVDIRLLSDTSPFLAGTKAVLALGGGCICRFLGEKLTLGEQRGSPVRVSVTVEGETATQKLPFIFSFDPQESIDRRDYYEEDQEEDDDQEESVQATKSHGKTRRKNYRFWLRADIRKAVRLSQTGLAGKEPRYHLFPPAEEVISLLREANGRDLFFDVETEDNLQLTCFGFAFDDKDIYVVPMLQTHKGNTYYYGLSDTCRILHSLSLAFARNRVVAHNGAFDLFVMAWRYGLPLPVRVFDTMLAHSRNYIETERSLGHVLSYYTDLPYHKNEGCYKPWNESQALDLYRYNGKDVFALTQLKPAIEAEALKLGASENVSLVNRSLLPYLEGTLRGARVDWGAVKSIVDYNTKIMAKMQAVVTTLAGFPLNPNSSQGKWSVKNYLYGEEGLGIKLPSKDPTNEKTLYSVLLKHPEAQVIPWILKYRQKAKQGRVKEDGEIGGKLGFNGWEGGTVLDKFPEPRFTTQWKYSPVTFRRASAKLRTFDNHWGDNFQNFEKYLRKIIVPDEGYSLVQIDEGGADARCVAWLCRAGEYRELFLNGIKPHQFIALHVFGDKFQARCKRHPGLIAQLKLLRVKDLKRHKNWKGIAKLISSSDNWPANERYYFIAKKICHASSYGMGPRTFRMSVLQETEGQVNLSNEEAKTFLDYFFKLFPEIKEWHREVEAQINSKRLLRNFFGHPRVFSSFYHGDAYREAYAFSPQSTVGQIIAYAVCELYERKAKGDPLLVEADYQFLQDGHDAILFQCRTPYVEEVIKTVQPHINRTLTNSRGESFEMRSEYQVGQSWDFKK